MELNSLRVYDTVDAKFKSLDPKNRLAAAVEQFWFTILEYFPSMQISTRNSLQTSSSSSDESRGASTKSSN